MGGYLFRPKRSSSGHLALQKCKQIAVTVERYRWIEMSGAHSLVCQRLSVKNTEVQEIKLYNQFKYS
jgi:hypothetical protein